MKYEVTNSRVESRHGSRFTVEETPATQDLCLFEINKHKIIGRRIGSWIVQPDQWIFIGKNVVHCLGRVVYTT